MGPAPHTLCAGRKIRATLRRKLSPRSPRTAPHHSRPARPHAPDRASWHRQKHTPQKLDCQPRAQTLPAATHTPLQPLCHRSPRNPARQTRRTPPLRARKSPIPDHEAGCAQGPHGPPAQPASLLLIPALNLKSALAQTTQNQPSSLLIIIKKSSAIIVTSNSNARDRELARGCGNRFSWPKMLSTVLTEVKSLTSFLLCKPLTLFFSENSSLC